LIFPFEEEIYRKAGIPATYVGHPLAHALPEPDRKAARERLGLKADGEYVVLMPGSRLGELKALARLFIETAINLSARRPQTRFLIPLVNRETRMLFEQHLHQANVKAAPDDGGDATADGEFRGLPLRMLYGHAHDALQAADAALIASGTATLEALLLDCPHVITYKVPWLTAQIMRRQALQPWIGLPNILAGDHIVPEIIQNQATPEALALALETLLSDVGSRQRQLESFRTQRARLKRNTPALIAQALHALLHGDRHAA